MFLTPRVGFVLGRITIPFLKMMFILFIFGSLFMGYNNIKRKLIELDKAKITITQQTDVINDLNKHIENIKKSNAVTVEVVTKVVEKKEVFKKKIIVKKKVIEEKLAAIEVLEIPKDDRNLQKSIVYINDLYSTYCAVDLNNCNNGA